MSPVSDALATVRYQRPWLPPAERVLEYYRLAEAARYYSNGGPCVRELESRLSARLGGAECVTVANCTLAIVLALQAVGDPGRRLVATPAYSFTATACAIQAAGFEPLFVDVDPESWQLDADELAAALDGHAGEVAAVLGCSTFGTPPAADVRAAWRSAADAHGVPLVLDSAAAFGAVDDAGRAAGTAGDVELFSFHATKPFAIGEGGLLVTTDAALASRVRALQNFGLDPVTRVSVEPGTNAKLSELAGACGLAMLDAFDEQLGRRRACVRDLRAALDGLPVGWQAGAEGSTWQVAPITVAEPGRRAGILTAAEAAGVEVRTPFDPPLHRHPAFAGAARHGSLAVSDALGARTVALPMANDLTADELARIAGAVRRGL